MLPKKIEREREREIKKIIKKKKLVIQTTKIDHHPFPITGKVIVFVFLFFFSNLGIEYNLGFNFLVGFV